MRCWFLCPGLAYDPMLDQLSKAVWLWGRMNPPFRSSDDLTDDQNHPGFAHFGGARSRQDERAGPGTPGGAGGGGRPGRRSPGTGVRHPASKIAPTRLLFFAPVLRIFIVDRRAKRTEAFTRTTRTLQGAGLPLTLLFSLPSKRHLEYCSQTHAY